MVARARRGARAAQNVRADDGADKAPGEASMNCQRLVPPNKTVRVIPSHAQIDQTVVQFSPHLTQYWLDPGLSQLNDGVCCIMTANRTYQT